MVNDCEQLSIDNGWSLTRKNACHIANQNSEMGELSASQISMDYRLQNIETYVQVNTWVWALIAATIITIAVKKIFRNGASTPNPN